MRRFQGTHRRVFDRLNTRRRLTPMLESLEERQLLASFLFDPDGPNNPNGTGSLAPIQAASFDFAVGNALADNSVPLAVGQTFQLYFQATLGTVIRSDGDPIGPKGLNTTFEITLVASLTEQVTSLTSAGTVATFVLAPTQRPDSFIRLYYDAPADSNALLGSGYSDGTLILDGFPDARVPNASVFSLVTAGGAPVLVPFDEFVLDNYPGVHSVQGSGSASLGGTVTTVNPAFFQTPNLTSIAFTSQTATPFNNQDPSAFFFDGSTVPVPANRGVINGTAAGGGTDFQFQADASANIHIASIDLVKLTNGTDNNTPTGPIVPVGSPVTFTYNVKNTGDNPIGTRDPATGLVGPFSPTDLDDDNGTPGDPTDDFNPTPVLAANGFNVGDIPSPVFGVPNGLIDSGEVFVFTATRLATPGQYTNSGTVIGSDSVFFTTVTDTDVDNHFGLVAAPPVPAPNISGRMTGGGNIVDPVFGKVTYGFQLHTDAGIVPNSFEINWGGRGRGSTAGPGQNWHLETLVSAQGFDTPIDQGGQLKNAPIDTYVGVGLGRLNGVSGFPAVWTIVDAGEPGSNDTFTITIYDRSNPDLILLSVSGTINGGNHQSHAENKSPTVTPPPQSTLPSQVVQ